MSSNSVIHCSNFNESCCLSVIHNHSAFPFAFPQHLGVVPPDSGDFHEMVCQSCMDHCPFLWAYASRLAGKEK